MQTLAQAWLVIQLGDKGSQLGLITAAQFLPMLFLGPYGGVITDRFPKRTLLYWTQGIAGLLALLLGILVWTNVVRLWMLYPFALSLRFVTVVDNPSRQTFVTEMVDRDHLTNALTLNSTLMNMARVIGPTIAALVIARFGLTACFISNGISYIAVLVALAMMRADELRPAPLSAKARGQVAEGLRYVWSHPVLRNSLLMMVIIGTLTYNFTITLPLFTKFALHGNEKTFSLIQASMGLGAVFGGLISAGRPRSGVRLVSRAAMMFGFFVLLVSFMQSIPLAMIAMALAGVASIIFNSLGNVTLQLETVPEMRGRVMSLWAVAFLGTTPIGGPIVGWIGEHAGARVALATGGVAAIVAAMIGLQTQRHPAKPRDPVVAG
jgi:MFS family permease